MAQTQLQSAHGPTERTPERTPLSDRRQTRIAPIALVARREIGDLLGDWRVLLPLLVVTFAVPLLAGGSLIGVERMFASTAIGSALMPLALAACGVLPAGFSLTSTSEIFVGERERNTLEALLSMPLTDIELYLGKLLGALLPPLIGVVCAIVTAAAPLLLGGSVDLLLLGALVGVALLTATTLIAAAVLISLHALSVRGANLLVASLLVPMGVVLQLEVIFAGTEQWLALGVLAGGLTLISAVLIAAGCATVDREALTSAHRINRVRATS